MTKIITYSITATLIIGLLIAGFVMGYYIAENKDKPIYEIYGIVFLGEDSILLKNNEKTITITFEETNFVNSNASRIAYSTETNSNIRYTILVSADQRQYVIKSIKQQLHYDGEIK